MRIYAWLVLLQRRGLINTWLHDLGLIDGPLRLVHNFTGTTIGMVHIMLPFMVLPLYASMRAINADYMRAAANLGASPVARSGRSSCRCRCRGWRPGSSSCSCCASASTSRRRCWAAARVMMWSMQIERNVTLLRRLGRRERARRRAAGDDARHPLADRAHHRLRQADGGTVMLSRAATETQITHGRRLWLYVVVGLIVVFLDCAQRCSWCRLSFSDSRYLQFPPPAWSTRWYEAYFSSIEWREATYVSFAAAILTMVVSTVLGTLAAYGLHMLRGRLSKAAYAVFTLPLIIPGILIAIGIFLFYAQLGLNNTLTGIVLAHSVVAIPLVVITVASSLKSYDMNQEMVARSLGASRPWAFLTVTLPQIKISRHFRRFAGVHHVARRGGDLTVYRGRRQGHADQAHVQCTPR